MNDYVGADYIDISQYDFLAPTTVIPLLCEIKKRNIKTIYTNSEIDYCVYY